MGARHPIINTPTREIESLPGSLECESSAARMESLSSAGSLECEISAARLECES